MRHPLAARVEHWPAAAVEELREREAILAADRLDPAAAEAQVRRSWLAWDGWPGEGGPAQPAARPGALGASDAHGQGEAGRAALEGE